MFAKRCTQRTGDFIKTRMQSKSSRLAYVKLYRKMSWD